MRYPLVAALMLTLPKHFGKVRKSLEKSLTARRSVPALSPYAAKGQSRAMVEGKHLKRDFLFHSMLQEGQSPAAG